MHMRLPITLIILSLVNPAKADEEPGSLEKNLDNPIEEVVVEVSRTGMTVLDMPVNTTIIDQQNIEESVHKTTDEILRLVPGFSMLRASDSITTFLTANTVSLRGLGGSAASRTLVLLDGIPIQSPYSSEVYWARVPKHQIERIEVVRGGGANSWGNLSLGGVINIVTEKPREKGLDFSGIVSYPKTIDMSLAGSHVSNRWSFSGEVSYFDTDGYKNMPEDQLSPIDENIRLDYANAYGKATYEISDRASIYFNGGYMEENRNSGTPLSETGLEVWNLGTGLDLDTADGSHWALSLFYDDNDVESTTVRLNSDGDEESINRIRAQPTSALGTGVVWSRDLGDRHSLSAGADYRWTDLDIDDFGRFLGAVPRELKVTTASQDLGGIFIQDTWSVNDRWKLSGSLRYDYVTNSGQTATKDLPDGVIDTVEIYDDNSENTVNPNIGARFHATEGISLRAAAYKGFRAPTMRELYLTSSTRGGVIRVNNPKLKPERLVGLEVGADFAFYSNVTLRLTLFQNTVEDLIQNITRGIAGDTPEVIPPCGLIGPGDVCRELDNVGEMKSTGLEMDVQYQPNERWSFYLSYLYNDTEVTKAPDDPQIIGNRIRQAPRSSFTARIRNYGRWFETSLTGRYVGERFEDDLNTLPVDDFFVLDLRFSRQVSNTTEVFLSIDNLLDEEYEIRLDTVGDILIGRPRFVGFGLRFRH